METKNENNTTNTTSQPPAGMNIPEWVMHLPTGLGTMGAEYMMFIKPLQEKMELQSRLIKEQGERIDALEDLLQTSRKTKRLNHSQGDDEDEDDDTDKELFQVKRKPSALPKYSKHARIKL